MKNLIIVLISVHALTLLGAETIVDCRFPTNDGHAVVQFSVIRVSGSVVGYISRTWVSPMSEPVDHEVTPSREELPDFIHHTFAIVEASEQFTVTENLKYKPGTPGRYSWSGPVSPYSGGSGHCPILPQ